MDRTTTTRNDLCTIQNSNARSRIGRAVLVLCHTWIDGWPGFESFRSKPKDFLRSAQSSPGHPIPQPSIDRALDACREWEFAARAILFVLAFATLISSAFTNAAIGDDAGNVVSAHFYEQPSSAKVAETDSTLKAPESTGVESFAGFQSMLRGIPKFLIGEMPFVGQSIVPDVYAYHNSSNGDSICIALIHCNGDSESSETGHASNIELASFDSAITFLQGRNSEHAAIADAVMLSAETAAGKYPIEVIRSMVRTIGSVEKQGKIFFIL